MDPYNLDNMDTYSNLLYVREMRVDLAYLAQEASEINKYRVETCCIIGKYLQIFMFSNCLRDAYFLKHISVM